MSRTARLAFVLVLGLLLTAPPSWAAGPTSRHAAPEGLTRLWSLITGLWADAGCALDPHGCFLPQGDAGCGIDPHGCSPQQAPAPLPQIDEGCGIDPHGGCLPRS